MTKCGDYRLALRVLLLLSLLIDEMLIIGMFVSVCARFIFIQ